MKRNVFILISAVAAAFVVGVLVRGWFGNPPQGSHRRGTEAANTAHFYTCSMHPQIQLSDPKAKCPLCGMDLIPVTGGSRRDDGPRELSLSSRAMKLAEVETAPVERKFVTADVRLVGKVEYDETKVAYITAWVPGRLDRLYVDYTGVSVTEGDHLAELYSPALLEAQQELLQSVSTAAELEKSNSSYLRERSLVNIESAREKLRLWGLTESQIDEIAREGVPTERVTISSPIRGIVVQKNAVEGMYVQTGSRIYTVADLSAVWAKLDAYESDLSWLHYGQEVELRTEAYPGEVFTGKIVFIDPILNPNTRTVKVRVNLPNLHGKLKPDMFVRAVVKSRVAQGGKVMDPGLAGKWISPMHPEIVKGAPGQCDICGMDLVSAESLGYVPAEAGETQAPLVIPSSAPLITGKRAVVYVAKGEGKFEGREIELGPRAGGYYLVQSGLQEGEQVVVKGNFKIDSAIQILAKPSMMNPDGGGPTAGHHHGPPPATQGEGGHQGHKMETAVETFNVAEGFRQKLDSATSAYLELQDAFSHDRFEQASGGVVKLRKALDAIDMSMLEGPAQVAWREHLKVLKRGADGVAAATDIKDARQAFEHVSNALIGAIRQFGSMGTQSLFVYRCSMAFGGRGGDWIQAKQGTENPYYGSEMFRCGSLKETLVRTKAPGEEHPHE